MPERTCSIDGCAAIAKARGWCRQHYNNWYRRGDPALDAPPRGGRRRPDITVPIVDRFWSKVDLSNPDGCWPWKGSMRHRYGEVWVDAGKQYAHRIAAALVFGDVADHEVVLHLCDNPPCVRPDHLRIGTQAENLRDMGDKGRWRNQYAIGPGHPDRAGGAR